MRPQITFPKNLKRALNYHEKKVQKGSAVLLHAHSFFKLPAELNFHDKRERFEQLMNLNERADTKLIHISLNFHPSEKDRLNKDFYVHLADEFMHKIGFGNQPYLVYQHNDAGHPHIHILSTLIQDNGKRISTHFMAKKLSEPVRKEMEKQYGFIPADKKEQQLQNHLAVSPEKIQAGKSETMRSITNVLDHVIDQYKYTSLQELNAILRLYNVKADRGTPESRTYKHRGLTYVVIDPEGKELTKPIKASSFHSKPTLDYIESKFQENEDRRQEDKKPLKAAIDWAMQAKPETLGELARHLQKENIDMIIRRSEEGQVYGITYVHHKNKVVFNGSDLGKDYAAKRMMERIENHQHQIPQLENTKQPILSKEHAEQKDHQSASASPLPTTEKKNLPTPVHEEGFPKLEHADQQASKIIEQVIDSDYSGGNAINKEMLTEEQRRKKKGFEKKWEM